MQGIGRIFEVKRFAVHDGPGIRTTVFFKGCPLKCLWCHNPEGIAFKPEIALLEPKCVHCGACFSACPQGLHSIGPNGEHVIDRDRCTGCFACVEACMPGALKRYGEEYTAESLLKLVEKDADFYQKSGGGVTCSGGEPLLQAEFVAAFFRLCKKAGFHTALDTSGYASWQAFEKVRPYTDLFLYDVKHMNPSEHKRLTGMDNRLILENLSKLFAVGAEVEIRMPVIPGLNDDDENLRQTADFLTDAKTLKQICPLPYHALSGSKYTSIGSTHEMPMATGDEHRIAHKVADYFAIRGLPVQYV